MLTIKKNSFITLIFILVIASFFRLWQLGNFPSGVTNDEAGYLYSSYSIWHTGHDVAGKFLPFSMELDNSFSPIPIYLNAPFVGILGLSPFSGRLLFALLGILDIGVLYLLLKEVTNDETLPLFGAFFLAISPWHIHISRIAYDSSFAFDFYLLGIFFFIKYIRRPYFYLSFVFFFLAFYSYHATKIYFIALIPFLTLYYYRSFIPRKTKLVGIIAFTILIFIPLIYISSVHGISRTNVLIWRDPTLGKIVDQERKYNSAPEVMQRILSNKGLTMARIFRENYIRAFSPQYLFLFGDPSGSKLIYSTLTNGELYIIELPFLLAGIYAALRTKKYRIFLYLLLIAPLPSAFASEPSYFNRSVLMLIPLQALIAIGAYFVYQKLEDKKRIYTYSILGIVGMLFIFLISEYLYTYYFRYPFFGAEAWGQSSKQVSQYISKVKGKYSKVYIDGSEPMFLFQYAFYNKSDPASVSAVWINYPSKQAHIQNVYFAQNCGDNRMDESENKFYHESNILIIAPEHCFTVDMPIKRFVDRGESLHVIWNAFQQ